jgi:hypothetical protein
LDEEAQMVNRPVPAPTTVRDVLHTTDRTLGSVIESVLGTPPTLDVVSQWRLEPPCPDWVAPPFAEDAPVLGRSTGYRDSGFELSHNLAYVDLSTVDPDVAEGLESGRVHLGQLFLDPRIDKYGFEFGDDLEAPGLVAEYEHRFSGRVKDLRPFAWRRYVAGMGRAISFVVVEALPLRTWGTVFARVAAEEIA